MFGSIKGKVILKTEKYLLLETGGVGYKINASPEVVSKAKNEEELMLFVHTHVKEDAIDLYGFSNREELEFFEMLISVSGIGPKSAIALLGIANTETLKKAIGSGDTVYLTKISGIGRKTADKIILELREKVGVLGESTLQEEVDALEALKSLGYSQTEAREALKKVKQDGDANIKIREALKILGTK